MMKKTEWRHRHSVFSCYLRNDLGMKLYLYETIVCIHI